MGNLFTACRKCKNWLTINISMDGYEGNEDIPMYKCKYHIPETLSEDEANFIDIKKCSMKDV